MERARASWDEASRLLREQAALLAQQAEARLTGEQITSGRNEPWGPVQSQRWVGESDEHWQLRHETAIRIAKLMVSR